jgi:hypothetical protein
MRSSGNANPVATTVPSEGGALTVAHRCTGPKPALEPALEPREG